MKKKAKKEKTKRTIGNIKDFIEKQSERIKNTAEKIEDFIKDDKIFSEFFEKIKNRTPIENNEELKNKIKELYKQVISEYNFDKLKKYIEDKLKDTKYEKVEDEFKKIIEKIENPYDFINNEIKPKIDIFLKEYERIVKEIKEKELLKKEMEKYKKLADEYLEISRSLKRDYSRLKERVEKEKKEIIEKANEKLWIDFLNIFDDFEKAIDSLEKHFGNEIDGHFKGIKMVYDKFKKLMNKYSIKAMEVIGKRFDPNIHEALMRDDDSEEEEGIITDVFRKGYYFGNKVIRSALVKVSSGKKSNKKDNEKNN